VNSVLLGRNVWNNGLCKSVHRLGNWKCSLQKNTAQNTQHFRYTCRFIGTELTLLAVDPFQKRSNGWRNGNITDSI
jgi:hypothetical protein